MSRRQERPERLRPDDVILRARRAVVVDRVWIQATEAGFRTRIETGGQTQDFAPGSTVVLVDGAP